jgi:hypothetical protein
VSLTSTTPYTSPQDFEFQSDASLIAKGAFTSSTVYMASGDTGAGTRVLWFPNKAAFRAGRVDTSVFSLDSAIAAGTEWDLTSTNANVGNYSVAFGQNTVAFGNSSVAFGSMSEAKGDYSLAEGHISAALGNNSVALGGGNTATGDYSTALGGHTQATQTGATAFGYLTSAGSYATAGGYSAYAVGSYSTAFGINVTGNAYCSLTVGRYGYGAGSSTSWTATDPLFELANGTSTSAPSDALVVSKNGNATFQGKIRFSPGGDLSMGSFTAGSNPATAQP